MCIEASEGSKNHAAPAKCETCGAELSAGAIWCKSCELFQADSSGANKARTRQCPKCGLYVPAAATKCYRCSETIDLKRWRFLPSPTFTSSLGPLTGLASALTLLLGAIGTFYDKHGFRSESNTIVAISAIDPERGEIVIDADNTGRKFAELRAFTLEVTVLADQTRALHYVEQLTLNNGPTLSLGHTDHAEPEHLFPTGAHRQWNFQESTSKAGVNLAPEEFSNIRDQMLKEEFEKRYTLQCIQHYDIRESASKKFESKTLSEGSDQWTSATCRRFLQTAYGTP